LQDVQTYLLQFQSYVQELMMLMGNLMKFKMRVPSFFKGALRTMTEKTVNDVFNKNDYSDPSTLKTIVSVRELNKRLGFSQKWTTDFAYRVIMLAKKEKQPQDQDTKR
jgi:Cft2 family RNA processing exonuclease